MEKSLAILMLFFYSLSLNAQGFSDEFNNRLKNIVPITPNAAELQKYSYYPVSVSTGTIDVNIPIYNVVQGELSLPISLSYHTGGIKVNEASTPVGLGWVLNAGGAIIRSQQGRQVDEQANVGYLFKKSTLPSANDISSYPTPEFFDYCADAVEGNPNDLEPDLFSFNFAGKTGVFYISKSGNIVSENKEPLRIEFINGNQDFKITDEQGVVYLFEGSYQLCSYTSSSEFLNGWNYQLRWTTFLDNEAPPVSAWDLLFRCNRTYLYNEQQYSLYIAYALRSDNATNTENKKSAWYLTKIIHPNLADTLYLDYQSMNYTSRKIISQSKEVLYNISCEPETGAYSDNLVETKSYINFYDKIISRIRYAKGEIAFNYSADRTEGFGAERLGSIDCKTREGKIIKRIELDNNKYFIANFDVNNLYPEENKRLKLEKVIFKDEALSNAYNYEFHYNEAVLPSLNSKAQDYWGYFNGKPNSSLIPKIEAYYKGQTPVFLGDADRRADENYMKAYILEKVYYPTGGFTAFEFTSHKTKKPITSSNITQIGGLRIDKIKLYPDKNDLTNYMVKRYQYSFQNHSNIGKLITNKGCEHNFSFNKKIGDAGAPPQDVPIIINGFTISSSPVYGINLPGYSNVEYDKVIEYEENATGQLNGRKEYEYNISGSPYQYHSSITNLPFDNGGVDSYIPNDLGGQLYDYYDTDRINFFSGELSNIYFSPLKIFYGISNRPLLHVERYFDKDNNIITETIKNYITDNIVNNESVTGMYVSSLVDHSNDPVFSPTMTTPLGRPYYQDKFNYFLYEIPIGKNLLSSESVIDYSSGNILTKTINYEYENLNGMIRRTQTINSDGKTLAAESWYPFDYSVNIPEISSLNEKHILSTPIMQLKKVDNLVTYATVTVYDNNANPQSIYSFDHSINTITFNKQQIVPLSGFEKAADIKYKDGRFSDRIFRDGIQHSYIWGYNNQYPTAEVLNANSNEIFFDSFEEGSGWDGTLEPVYSERPITAYDNTKPHAGRASARIDKFTSGEQYSHYNKELNISLSQPTKFKYSGWVYSGGPSADIYLFMKRAGESYYFTYLDYVTTSTTGEWVFLEKEFTVPQDVVKLGIRIDNNGGGQVWFDDIRLHPSAAQMTTYTYAPLVGMTSQTDVNNRTTYFEYDGFGRLFLVRDQDKKILKKYCYNYAGQPEACQVSTAADWQPTGNVRCVKDASSNNTGYQEKEEVDRNAYSASYNQSRWVSNGLNTTACPLPGNCTSSACTSQGPQYKCVNGSCEMGYKVFTDSYYDSSAGGYICIYHYEWSDGSWSQDYTQFSGAFSCNVGG